MYIDDFLNVAFMTIQFQLHSCDPIYNISSENVHSINTMILPLSLNLCPSQRPYLVCMYWWLKSTHKQLGHYLWNLISFSNFLHYKCDMLTKLAHYKEYLIRNMDADGLEYCPYVLSLNLDLGSLFGDQVHADSLCEYWILEKAAFNWQGCEGAGIVALTTDWRVACCLQCL